MLRALYSIQAYFTDPNIPETLTQQAQLRGLKESRLARYLLEAVVPHLTNKCNEKKTEITIPAMKISLIPEVPHENKIKKSKKANA